MSKLDKETEQRLLSQLVKLGDMLGDGDCEPWVGKEYRRVCTALGYTSNRRRTDAATTAAINEKMVERCAKERCPHCKLERTTLKQARSGSMSAKCTICDRSYKLLRRSKK